MSDNIRIHIGDAKDMGQRFIDAWRRAERGEAVNETNLTFLDLESVLAALTPKRLHLLRYVRHHPVANIKALAADLHRVERIRAALDRQCRSGIARKFRNGFRLRGRE